MTSTFPYDAPRWISRDPSGERGGINLYEYANNSPIIYVDPDGKNPLVIIAGGYAAYKALQAAIAAYSAYESAKALSDEIDAYNATAAHMRCKYGDDLPDGVQTALDNWRNSILGNFGNNVAPIIEGIPGTSFTGPAGPAKPSLQNPPAPLYPLPTQ